jgi:hypothetical protein
VVHDALDDLAQDYSAEKQGAAQKATMDALSDPDSAARVAMVTEQLNRQPIDPVTRAALSTPGVLDTYLAEVIAGQTERAEEVPAGMGRTLEALSALVEEQAETNRQLVALLKDIAGRPAPASVRRRETDDDQDGGEHPAGTPGRSP